MKNTAENNKLIAGFMNLKPVEHLGRYSISKDHCTCNEDTAEKAMEGFGSIAKYATSWDWLMPVVEKIESLRDHGFTIYRSNIHVNGVPLGVAVVSNVTRVQRTKIEATYQALTEFILWWNDQPAPKN